MGSGVRAPRLGRRWLPSPDSPRSRLHAWADRSRYFTGGQMEFHVLCTHHWRSAGNVRLDRCRGCHVMHARATMKQQQIHRSMKHHVAVPARARLRLFVVTRCCHHRCDADHRPTDTYGTGDRPSTQRVPDERSGSPARRSDELGPLRANRRPGRAGSAARARPPACARDGRHARGDFIRSTSTQGWPACTEYRMQQEYTT